jgi:uncharacterized protein (TIGR02117 family)
MTTVPRTVHANDGRGDWIRTSDLHTPSVMRYQAALRPDWPAHLGRRVQQGKVRREADLARRRRTTRKSTRWTARAARLLVLIPILYCLAALGGSLIPVNRDWTEATEGTTIYLADNGVHADIVMPVTAQGLNWAPIFPLSDFAAVPPGTGWIAFGTGERHVYLDTPRWRDIRLSTIGHALAGGPRVMHVEYVADPGYAARQIRLRPEEYRRLWAAVRADLLVDRRGRPQRLDHPGYGSSDAFYRATGRASAIRTCNSVVAGWLRLAGVRTSLWPPFVQGLVWRYRLLDA